jgi:hypothetical protein
VADADNMVRWMWVLVAAGRGRNHGGGGGMVDGGVGRGGIARHAARITARRTGASGGGVVKPGGRPRCVLIE